MHRRSVPAALLLSALCVLAAPSPASKRAAAPYAIATTQMSQYTPYTWYASTAYCSPSSTLAWNCGANCNANSGFIPVASGGDGAVTQFWYVGYDPSLASVIVAHQGTDWSAILPAITDVDLLLENLDTTAFPGMQSQGMEVHMGFQSTFLRSAPSVLSAVQTTMSKYNTKTVTTTGHSLGAAIALLDAVYLPLHLPAGTVFKSVVYGLPRVGNQAFANYVDSGVSNVHLTHINNMKDPVPTLPPQLLGYHHPSGEVHIETPSSWYSCPGQENTSTDCELGDVPNILDADFNNHDGPYGPVTNGVLIYARPTYIERRSGTEGGPMRCTCGVSCFFS